MTTIEEQITELKAKLTGNIFEDGELMMEIYNLKKQLNPEIVDNPELDDDDLEECLYCGS
jgi:regulator of replication initiation timing